MTASDPFGLGNALGDLTDRLAARRARSDRLVDEALDHLNRKSKPATTPQLRGQYIGDDYYIRADDIAALLEAKGVMPNLAAALKRKGRP